jgi:hypothetical protein
LVVKAVELITETVTEIKLTVIVTEKNNCNCNWKIVKLTTITETVTEKP